MSRDPGLRSRLLIGAIAGIAGAVAISVAARNMQRRRQGAGEPRATERGETTDDKSAGRLVYGAACGSLLAAANVRAGQMTGALAGAGIWLGSMIGWVPAIARSAKLTPRYRNVAMIGFHLLWGVTTAHAMRALLQMRDEGRADEDV